MEFSETGITSENLHMSPIAISIIHPEFQQLKKASRSLHLLAALFITANAFLYVQHPEANRYYFWGQLIVAADILILFVAGKELIADSPKFNLFFRITEVIVFSTFCVLLFFRGEWLAACIQAVIAAAFVYLFYYERKSAYAENISIQHLGINIPGFPNDRFISWIDIKSVETNESTIVVETRVGKTFQFQFRTHLSTDEEKTIREYFGYYLK